MHVETRIGCFICKEPFVPSSDPSIEIRRYSCGHVFHRKCVGSQQELGLYKCLICGLPCNRNIFKTVYFVGVTVNVKEPENVENKVISEESNNFTEENDKQEKEVEFAQERSKRALDDKDLMRDLNKVQSEITGYFLRDRRTLWHYQLWSFKSRNTKLERFLNKKSNIPKGNY